MKKTRKRKKAVSADAIARQAQSGKDVSKYFTNAGQMMAQTNYLLLKPKTKTRSDGT